MPRWLLLLLEQTWSVVYGIKCMRESRNYSAKLFDRKFRMSLITDLKLSIIVLGQEKINSFWNKIQSHQKRKLNSSLNAQIIADFYWDEMCDDSTPFDEFQQMVHDTVKTTFKEWSVKSEHIAFTDRQIERAITAIRKNVSPGIDGITAEHLSMATVSPYVLILNVYTMGCFERYWYRLFLRPVS